MATKTRDHPGPEKNLWQLRLLEDFELALRVRNEMSAPLAEAGPQDAEAKAFWKDWNQHSLEVRMKFKDWIKEMKEMTEHFAVEQAQFIRYD
ncbi:MAG: hypothetical protein LQ350_004743 [Teloschistes chrysophthalmus]|nr:MAG: hypothetical protein LQ350_004743 [Niorma chrysophthalma]